MADKADQEGGPDWPPTAGCGTTPAEGSTPACTPEALQAHPALTETAHRSAATTAAEGAVATNDGADSVATTGPGAVPVATIGPGGGPAASTAKGYAATVALGFAAAGGVALSVAQPWLTARATVDGLPLIRVQVDGAEIAPLAAAFGFVLLAAFGAVIATRGWVRRGLGALVVALAIVTAISVLGAAGAPAAVEDGLAARGWSGGGYSSRSTGWRWLAGIGALGCLVAGSLVAWRGGTWPAMGSRYDAPPDAMTQGQPGRSPEQPLMTEADVWRAIDRGHDPTQAP
jgi:uncharacterized membrane protein (TIGR02234 family)